MITRMEGHLLLPTDHAHDLLEIIDLVTEVLRYGGHDLHQDIAERYQPGTCQHLITALDHHAGALHHAIKPTTTEETQ